MRNPTRLAVVVIAALGISLLWGFGGQEGGVERPEMDGQHDLVVRGPIQQWIVNADGSIAMQVESRLVGDQKARRDQQGNPLAETKLLWMVTPPDLNDSTRFEELALDVILTQESSGREATPLTFWLESARSRDGSTLEKALEIRAMGRVGAR